MKGDLLNPWVTQIWNDSIEVRSYSQHLKAFLIALGKAVEGMEE